ncbi:MAG: methyltransferase domain-containing protein [Planctomycetes bacterium]|nr:methyltransferase domain-containing protein [Planctomycetota bacterium]
MRVGRAQWLAASLVAAALVGCRSVGAADGTAGPAAAVAPRAQAQAAAAPATAPVAAPKFGPDGLPIVDVAAINQPFLEAKEVAKFVARFERESREIFTDRVAIADAVRLRPGDRVADVGAGTGLFAPYFSLAVGAHGKVIAVDIAPLFLEHVRQRTLLDSLPNVTTLLCDQATTNLPSGSVDVVFICDTYHHFEQPAATLASIHAALVPGGRLVVIDFHKIKGQSSDFVMGHVRADEATAVAEITAAGFAPVRREGFLKENWFREFVRTESGR